MEKAKVILNGETYTCEGTYEEVNEFLQDFIYEEWLAQRRAAKIPDCVKGTAIELVNGVIGGFGYEELQALDNSDIVDYLNRLGPGMRVYYMPED